jgi:hypothetical protein
MTTAWNGTTEVCLCGEAEVFSEEDLSLCLCRAEDPSLGSSSDHSVKSVCLSPERGGVSDERETRGG